MHCREYERGQKKKKKTQSFKENISRLFPRSRLCRKYANDFLDSLLKQELRTAKAIWRRNNLLITSSLKEEEKTDAEHLAKRTPKSLPKGSFMWVSSIKITKLSQLTFECHDNIGIGEREVYLLDYFIPSWDTLLLFRRPVICDSSRPYELRIPGWDIRALRKFFRVAYALGGTSTRTIFVCLHSFDRSINSLNRQAPHR